MGTREQCMEKLMKYYELTDKNHQIYAASTFLSPTERLDFFKIKRTGSMESWIPVVEGRLRDVWQKEYAHLARKDEPQKNRQTMTPGELALRSSLSRTSSYSAAEV